MRENSNPIRVLIADDHNFLREAMAFNLSQYPELEIVGEVSTGKEAVDRLRALDGGVDVVLMDVRMRDANGIESGIEATKQIHTSWPGCAVLLLTTYPQYSEAGMRAGARGYLLKSVDTDELIVAIRTVNEGGIFFQNWQQAPEVLLSDQEMEILKAISNGASNNEISEILPIAPGSVKRLLTVILRKLDARSRAHAVAIALRRGIIS